MLRDELKQLEKEIKKALNKTPHKVGVLAKKEFKLNFKRQAFFNESWKPRKKDGKPALIGRTNQIEKNIFFRSRKDEVVIFNPLPFAFMHNEGFIGVQKVAPARIPGSLVKAHFRKRTQAPVKGSNRKAHKRKAYSQKINLPKRQFIGKHPDLDKKITNEIDKVFSKIFK